MKWIPVVWEIENLKDQLKGWVAYPDAEIAQVMLVRKK